MIISLLRRPSVLSTLSLIFVICVLLLSLNLTNLLGIASANVFAVGILSGSVQQLTSTDLEGLDCDTTGGGVSSRWLAAEYARMAGDVTQADKLYKLLVNCNQREELAIFRLGQRHWFNGQRAAALAIWTPEIASPVVLTDCEYSMERADAENLLEICEIASSLAPDSAIGWEGVGKAYEDLNAPTEALVAYEKALNRSDNKRKEISVLLAMVRLYRSRSDHESIIQLLSPYRDGLTSALSFQLGRAYHWKNETTIAVRYFREAIDKASVPTGLQYVYLGEALLQISDRSGALAALEEVVRIEREGSYSHERAEELLQQLEGIKE